MTLNEFQETLAIMMKKIERITDPDGSMEEDNERAIAAIKSRPDILAAKKIEIEDNIALYVMAAGGLGLKLEDIAETILGLVAKEMETAGILSN